MTEATKAVALILRAFHWRWLRARGYRRACGANPFILRALRGWREAP